jgi:hypothetical protein
MDRPSAPPPFLLTWRNAVVGAAGPKSPITRHVLLTLGVFMDGAGRCFPSTSAVASATALAERTARTHLQAAESDGWIARTTRRGSGGQGWRRYEYRATLPEGAAGDTAPSSSDVRQEVPDLPPKVRHLTTEGAASDDIKVRQEVPLNSPVELLKNSDGAFDRAWSLYPKRAGGNARKSARRAWDARIRAGVAAGDLIAGVERYAAFVRASGNEGTPYVKQAATFLGPDEHWAEGWEIPTDSAGSAPLTVVVVDD